MNYATSAPRARGPRAVARRLALDALSLTANAAALARPRIQFLILHHVFEDEADPFRRHLAALARGHRFLGITPALDEIRAGVIPSPAICVTFDDGLASCARAASILAEFGARACFYVCPPIVGERDPARIAAFCRDGLRQPPLEFLGWDDMERLRDLGHEIGAHTRTHPDLSRCSRAQLDDELGGSRQLLRDRLGGCEHFAWPFGQWTHFSPEARRAAIDAGYSSIASAERGCHAPAPGAGAGELCLRRDNLMARWPRRHLRYFLARNATRPVGPANPEPSAVALGFAC